jgi:hypothetical protein
MPDDANMQQSSQAPEVSSASVSERPKPPRVLKREPEPPPKGLIQRLIKRIAV